MPQKFRFRPFAAPRRTLAVTLGAATWTLAGIASATTSAEPAAPRAPEAIYQSSCKFCHGHQIAPGIRVAPDLLGRALDPQSITYFVRNGPRGMLAFRKADISDRELEALAKWIASSPAPAGQVKS